ncbi:unnamed protein product [Strongylus vulgaris]|uniref:Uncharacterized protein n=1 Tax=Strongylus vulgaris TaxID=40348 RepID=A0A3P7JGJ5_STRVU|nr:unnamed protein product [Strongylus vulgaris]
MQLLIVFLTLLAISLAKSVNLPGHQTTYYGYALDMDVLANYNTFTCIKSYGYSTVFIRAYNPAGVGSFDMNAVGNIRNAYQGKRAH